MCKQGKGSLENKKAFEMIPEPRRLSVQRLHSTSYVPYTLLRFKPWYTAVLHKYFSSAGDCSCLVEGRRFTF